MRLALLVRPGMEFIALVFALFKAGAVVVLIDPGMGMRNMIGCLADAEPEGFVAIPMAQAVRALLARRFRRARFNVTVGRRLGWGGLTLDELRRRGDPAPVCHRAESDDPAAIIFTTGSTGPPKGVLYCHGNFDRQVTELGEFYGIEPGEIDLPGFPLFGLFNCALGVTTVIPDMDPTRPARVDPRNIIEAIDDWRVTQAFGSPAIWNRVGQYCQEHNVRLPTLGRVLSAGAPVPPHVLARMKAAIAAEGDVHTPYGATEALPVASIAASEVLAETERVWAAGGGTCVGRRFPGIEWKVIRIVDGPIATMDEAVELPRGEIGELIVCGPGGHPTLRDARRIERSGQDRRGPALLASHGRRRLSRPSGSLLVLWTVVAARGHGVGHAVHGSLRGDFQSASGRLPLGPGWHRSAGEPAAGNRRRAVALSDAAGRCGAANTDRRVEGPGRRQPVDRGDPRFSDLPRDAGRRASQRKDRPRTASRLGRGQAEVGAAMFALVTGAGGFLGQYLVDALVARGNRVRALVRRPCAALERAGVEQVLADVRDASAVAAACAGVDVVHHAAGIAGIWGPWDEFYGINVVGTRNVIRGCREHRVPRLVYTSSPSVTFDGTAQEGIDERAPYPRRWLNHYQHTKALAEQEVLAACDGALSTCVLRPHLIWGPGDRHLIPRLVERARAGQLRRVGDGRNLIDMVYVENAARAHLQAADALSPGSAACGRAYFISQGEPVNCWRWIDEILALAGLPPVERSISLAAAWRIGAALETAYRVFRLRGEPRMTRFLAAQLGTSHYFNIAAARRDFGYQPAIDKAEGMRRLAGQFARHPAGAR